jgi:hypothetical protein
METSMRKRLTFLNGLVALCIPALSPVSAPGYYCCWLKPVLLDSLSIPATVAYSTRKLRRAYAGSAINVRRDNDNTTQDIGFDGSGNLNTASLVTFYGTANCFITTWYDQSGNANNSTMATTANQPRILAGPTSTIDTLNSHPAIRFGLSSATNLQFTLSLSQPNTISLVARLNTLSSSGAGHFTDGVSASPRQIIGQFGVPSTSYGLYAGTVVGNGGALDFVSHALIGIFNGASSSLVLDRATIISGTNIGTNGLGAQGIGAGNGGGGAAAMDGWLPEYIVFPSALGPSDQALIRASDQAYWGTP